MDPGKSKNEYLINSFGGIGHAAGPDGRVNGATTFLGQQSSYIEFLNGDGGVLDVHHSITILCWVFDEGQEGPLFFYNGATAGQDGVLLGVSDTQLYFKFRDRHYNEFPGIFQYTSLAGEWKFVGASYNGTTGESKLWIDGDAVQTAYLPDGIDLATKDNVFIGVDNVRNLFFKGRITQMGLYNISLSRQQVRRIMGKSPFQVLQSEIIGNT